MRVSVARGEDHEVSEKHQLMQPGVGTGLAFTGLAIKMFNNILGGTLWGAIRNKGLTPFLKGFAGTAAISSLSGNGWRIFGGAVTGDRTIAGDGVAGLTGDAVMLSVGSLGLGIARLAGARLGVPIIAGVIGSSFTLGGFSGHVARDHIDEFRHFTDDIIAHDVIIKYTPDAIKVPGSHLYTKVMDAAHETITYLKSWDEGWDKIIPPDTPSEKKEPDSKKR